MLRVMHLVSGRATNFGEYERLDLAEREAAFVRECICGYGRDYNPLTPHTVWIENELSATRSSGELVLRAEDLVAHASCHEVSDHRVRFLARGLTPDQRVNLAAWLRNAARVAEDIVRSDELERQKWIDSERLRLGIQAVREHPQEPTPRERRLVAKAERTLDVDQLLGEL